MKKTNALISFIIPLYNAKEYISNCINSILKQTYLNYEILLINDGSNDGSDVICDEYSKKDSRIKVFSKPNGGVSSARNLGLEKAQGDYIAFVDIDDEIKETYIEDFKISEINADLYVCGYECIWKNHDKECPETKVVDFSKCDIQEYLKKVYFRAPWSKLLKRDIIVLNNIKFDCKLKYGEDTAFMLDYLRYTNTISLHSVYNYVYYIRNICSITKYGMDTDVADYHIATLYNKIELIENKNKIDLSRIKKFLFQSYSGLFVKYIYYNCNIYIFLQKRKDYIKKYGKHYFEKAEFMHNYIWRLFLMNAFTASMVYLAYKIRKKLSL